MNRALLDKFLGKGIMVSPAVAGTLTDDDYEKIISGSAPTVLDERALQKIRDGSRLAVASQKIIRSEVTVKDFLEYYKNKIKTLGAAIARVLEEKPVSINKMLPGRRNVILGIVREPGGNIFYLEDMTGRCAVSATTQHVKEDDVLAVSGIFSGNVLSAEEIFYPELPIKRDVAKTNSPAVFYFGASSPEHHDHINGLVKNGADLCAFFADAGDLRKITVVFSEGGAATTRVVSGASKMSISICGIIFKLQFLPGCAYGDVEYAARSFSKRRYASPIVLSPVFDEDFNFIEDDTDFVFFGSSGSTGFANHKGRTFVSVSDGLVGADLNTRIIKAVTFKSDVQL